MAQIFWPCLPFLTMPGSTFLTILASSSKPMCHLFGHIFCGKDQILLIEVCIACFRSQKTLLKQTLTADILIGFILRLFSLFPPYPQFHWMSPEKEEERSSENGSSHFPTPRKARAGLACRDELSVGISRGKRSRGSGHSMSQLPWKRTVFHL